MSLCTKELALSYLCPWRDHLSCSFLSSDFLPDHCLVQSINATSPGFSLVLFLWWSGTIWVGNCLIILNDLRAESELREQTSLAFL